MSDVKLIPVKTDEFKAAIEHMKRNLDNFNEYISISVKMQKIKYDALIKEGFTEEQALELVKRLD